MAASATLALKAGVWFRRGRLLIVSPDSLGTACPLSGRNSTYRPVQILETGSVVWNFEIFPPFKKLGDNIYREGIAMTGECTATFEEKAAPTLNHLVIPEMWSAR